MRSRNGFTRSKTSRSPHITVNVPSTAREQGAFATYMDPAALGRFVDQELITWSRVIKAADIRAD